MHDIDLVLSIIVVPWYKSWVNSLRRHVVTSKVLNPERTRGGQRSAMACGCVSQSSAILYVFFIFYLHYSTSKNIFSIVDLPEAYKDKPKVDFYPENLHIAVIPHFIAKPRVQNCTPRNRPFCSNRSRLTYSLLRLSLSGDIHPSPGPAAASNNSPKCPVYQSVKPMGILDSVAIIKPQ